MDKGKHLGGRPTDYKSEYCEKIIEYFNKKPYIRVKLKYYYKNGETKDILKEIPADFPTFEGFASSIGVHRETLLNWCNKYTEFFDAYKLAKEHQKNILIQNGLKGNYNCLFAKFVAINATDMRDKQTIEHGGEIKTKINTDDKESIKKELLDLIKKEQKEN